jgi:hypothetical protein
MPIDNETFRKTLAQLREPFPPAAHVERALPGGGKWFYIPWQQIRERIEEVCPDYEIEFSDPIFVDAYCSVRCKMTICGVSRSVNGCAEVGKSGGRGNPIEVAVADAYKNAAEAFGVCAYLDDQSKEKREWTAKYLNGKGDGRALKEMMRNGDIPGNFTRSTAKPTPVSSKAPSSHVIDRIVAKETELGLIRAQTKKVMADNFGTEDPAKLGPNQFEQLLNLMDAFAQAKSNPELGEWVPVISAEQVKRFWSIARKSGYTDEGVRALLSVNSIGSSKEIPRSVYEALCEDAESPQMAAFWNNKAPTEVAT